MSLDTDIQLLGTVPLLSDFTEEKLRLLAFSSENRTYRDGQRLYGVGERADSAFVIARGKVALFAPGDAEKPAAVIGPPGMLGGLNLIVEGNWSESAEARGDVIAIQIRRPLFRRMLDEYPEIAQSLHARISADLADTMHDLVNVGDRLSRLS